MDQAEENKPLRCITVVEVGELHHNLMETRAELGMERPWQKPRVGEEVDGCDRNSTSARASRVRLNTRKPGVCSVWPEEDEGGRNRRRNMKSGEKNRRPCAQLGASRDDSAHQEVEDDEAHPPVPSEWRGMVYSGSAMAR
jgi:hypothetical protein